MNTRRLRYKALGLALMYAASALAQTAEPGTQHSPQPEPSKPDLSEKLIRKAVTDSDEDIMATILRLMGQTARTLKIEFNPGPDTQQMQQEITRKLDEAIEKAALDRKQGRGGSGSQSSDRRRMPQGETARSRTPGENRSQPGNGPGDRTMDVGKDARATDAGPKLFESRRTWGSLPNRDRDEIIQGSSEKFLERYRRWIEQYYRALQEADQGTKPLP